MGWLGLCLIGCADDAAPAKGVRVGHPRGDAGAHVALDASADANGDAALDSEPSGQVVVRVDAGPARVLMGESLAELLGVADPVPVGVAVDPDTGLRYILDAESGLYRIVDGHGELVADLEELVDPAVTLDSPFTDLSACGQGRFLLTARNDGFVFDVNAHSFMRHFCYVPEILSVMIPDAGQLTGSVGCDGERIYAQPQTFDGEGFLIQSQVGVWDLKTGDDLMWFDLEDRLFLAGGLVPWTQDRLLLVSGADYYAFDLGLGSLEQLGSLRQFGVTQGDGLAYDARSDEVLVSDGATDRLYAVPATWLAVP